MCNIETLEIYRREKDKSNYFIYLISQKVLVDQYFNWVDIKIEGKYLKGKGILKPVNSNSIYSIDLYYSPFLWKKEDQRYDRIYVKNLDFNHKLHMYYDNSLCLYYPPDHFYSPPLYQILGWLSEWFVKYEFFKRFDVWIGDEVPH